jgi:hypothetical protein
MSISGVGRHVSLYIGRRHDAIQYFTRGHSGREGLSGTFGRFGSVDVRFEPEGDPRFYPGPDWCTGGSTVQRGTFTGTVEYLGDGVYSPASTTQAHGTVMVTRMACDLAEPPPDPEPPRPEDRATALEVWSGGNPETATSSFEALQQDGKRHAFFYASAESEEDDVEIYRTVYRAAPSDRFAFSMHEHEAQVSPPPPFAGDASLTRSAQGKSWAGPLTADFPGLGPVPLAGPGFTARLWRVTVLLLGKAERSLRRFAGQLTRYAGKYPPASRPLLSSR